MRAIILCIAALICTPACSSRDVPDESQRLSRSLCLMVGNVPSEQYCQTTFTQLLSRPEFFDGRRVLITGWAYEVEGVVALFPTKDAFERADLSGSLVIGSGRVRNDLASLLSSNTKWNPRMVAVGGVVRLRGSFTRNERRKWPERYGIMYEANELRP